MNYANFANTFNMVASSNPSQKNETLEILFFAWIIVIHVYICIKPVPLSARLMAIRSIISVVSDFDQSSFNHLVSNRFDFVSQMKIKLSPQIDEFTSDFNLYLVLFFVMQTHAWEMKNIKICPKYVFLQFPYQ